MTTTTSAAPPRRQAGDPDPSASPPGELLAPPPKLRRRPMLIAGSVAAISIGALLSVWAFTAASDTHAVLAVRTTIERGQVIDAEDLMSVTIGVDPALQPVSTDRASEIIGKRAALDMSAGGVVTAAQVSDQLVPPTGKSLVGISLAPGLFPGSDLQLGSPVRVVSTPGDQGVTEVTTPESTDAVVVGVTTDEVAGTTIVTVEVPFEAAPRVAAQAATGKVAIVADSQER